MSRRSLKRVGLPSLLLAAACSNSPTQPKLPPCTISGGMAITLAVGQYAVVDPTPTSGCIVFPGNASGIDSAEYLLVAQSVTRVPGKTSGFVLHGDTLRPLAGAASVASLTSLSPAERFHAFLREAEARRWYGEAPAAPSGPPVLQQPGPPPVGDVRQFSVCAKLDCSRFDNVTATAKVVLSHVALYVDNTAPAPPKGLDSLALDSIARTFSTRLYPLDTTAFGRESDINNDSVVVILMTPVVNRMVTAADCPSGFVAGFFYSADIDPAYTSRYNHMEIFYTLVADPDGLLSCPHTTSYTAEQTPVTLVHEFQHMISFNQHVLVRGGSAEVLWLNEGMSHFAEELGGRSYLPGDQTTFTRFVIGDLENAYAYLDATGNHFLLAPSGIGTLAERGAAWLFVRYVTDQFRTDTSFTETATFTRKLLRTDSTGAGNAATATGVPFDSLVTRWALANWVSDLPVAGFAAPANLKYVSWSFRTTYGSLHTQNPAAYPNPFPLVPGVSAGEAVNLAGTLRAGSGVYQRALQGPSAPGYTLLFSDARGSALPAAVVPRLSIIRIR